NPVRMRDNLRLSNGAIFGEYAMMRLGREVGKHKGHEMVHDAAVAAASSHSSFLDQLAALPGGTALSEDIRAMMESGGAAGLCKEYALHFSALTEAMGDGPLPTPEQRKLRLDTT